MLRSRQNVKFARFHAICYSQTSFFQKWIVCKSACLSDAKMMKISQKFKILIFKDFFDHFESFQDATSVFYFWFFREFGVPDHEIWQNPWLKIHSQLRHLFQGFAFFLPYLRVHSHRWGCNYLPENQGQECRLDTSENSGNHRCQLYGLSMHAN